MLNATLNKQGLIRIAAQVLLVDLSTHLCKLHIRDFLSTEELNQYIKARAVSGQNVQQHRVILESYRENERHSARMFWNRKAHGAARRQYKVEHPARSIVIDLAWLFEDLFRKQKGQCLYCSAPLRVSKGKAWNNASPDRRIPARQGGSYSKSNVDIVCVGCQFSKWWYSDAAFRTLLLAMTHAKWKYEESRLTCEVNEFRQDVTLQEEERLVMPWCRKTLAAMKSRKSCHLEIEDLLLLVQANWLGAGSLIDAAGIALPLQTISVDRIDSAEPYKRGNIRLLLWGLNSLKGADIDDSQIAMYLRHIRDSQQSIKAAVPCLPEPDRRLPFHNLEIMQDGLENVNEPSNAKNHVRVPEKLSLKRVNNAKAAQ